jgi:hypothetical protein
VFLKIASYLPLFFTLQWSLNNVPGSLPSASEVWPSFLMFSSQMEKLSEFNTGHRWFLGYFLQPLSLKFGDHIKTLIEPVREHNLLKFISQSLLKGPAEYSPDFKNGYLRNDSHCSRNTLLLGWPG